MEGKEEKLSGRMVRSHQHHAWMQQDLSALLTWSPVYMDDELSLDWSRGGAAG